MRPDRTTDFHQQESAFISSEAGFHAMKSVATKEEIRVITIHLSIAPSRFSWHHHQLLMAYLKSAVLEETEEQEIDVVWYYQQGDLEVFEMGKDYEVLFEMNFRYRERC